MFNDRVSGNEMKNCSFMHPLFLVLQFLCFRSNIKHLIFDIAFHHQMKHLEVHQKYCGAHHIFNSRLSVSSSDETLHLMLDVLQDNHQEIHHFHIDHNAPCLLYPPKFCITIVLDFS